MQTEINGNAPAIIQLNGVNLNELRINGNTVWSGSLYLACFPNDGVYYAYAHATTWVNKTNITSQTCYVRYIERLGLFILATRGGVYYSSNGVMFSLANITSGSFLEGLPNASTKTTILTLGDTILISDCATVQSTIPFNTFTVLTSTDGVNWKLNTTDSHGSEGVESLSNMTVWNNNFVYIDVKANCLYKSTNGETWTKITNVSGINEYNLNYQECSNIFVYGNTLAFFKISQQVYFTNGIYNYTVILKKSYLVYNSEYGWYDWNDKEVNIIETSSTSSKPSARISPNVFVNEQNSTLMYFWNPCKTNIDPECMVQYKDTEPGTGTNLYSNFSDLLTESAKSAVPDIMCKYKNVLVLTYSIGEGFTLISEDSGLTWTKLSDRCIYSIGGK